MGISQTKEKSSGPSERGVAELKNKVRLLQGEMEELMCIREKEIVAFSFKQAEWKRERKRLKGELKKLAKAFQEKLDDGFDKKQLSLLYKEEEEEREKMRDETVEKWKHLYFAIKTELDHLIHRTTTHQEERECWKTEPVLEELRNEVKAKEGTIATLQTKLGEMEQQEMKREREMDILRQSLRIMCHNKRAPVKFIRRAIQ